MELLEKLKKAEKYKATLEAEANVVNSQLNRLLMENGYNSVEEAIQEYKDFQDKLPEYEEKLDNFLTKVKTLLEKV